MSTTVEDNFIPTGFQVIDKQQGGLSRGRVYAVGAPSGGGKSVLANQISINAYKAGFSVLYGSLEMNREECLMRTQSNITRIPHDRFQLKTVGQDEKIRSDKTLVQFLQSGAKSGKPLEYLCPTYDITLAQFFTQAAIKKFDLVVVDYINLFAPLDPKKELWWNIGEGFRLAKIFAKRMNCAVIMLVQIDEETGNLKYAKSIKHHSDGVWVWMKDEKNEESGIVEVEQVKLRNFKPNKFVLKPEFEFCSFTESFGAGALSTVGQELDLGALKPMSL